MNQLLSTASMDRILTRSEVAGLVALASRSVSPLWPLESAIAVNPLAAYEDLPFADAVSKAAEQFGARKSLPIPAWRQLMEREEIDYDTLRDAAIRHLGGIYDALATIVPGVTALDVLMVRLIEIETPKQPETVDRLPLDAAFIAKWCAAFFDQGLAASPMPHRELGLYRAVLAMASKDRDYNQLTGAAGKKLLLTVPRDPLEAIAEGLAVTDRNRGDLEHLRSLIVRLPGWAGHIRWRREHSERDFAKSAPATMADLLALWLLIERAGSLSKVNKPAAEVENIPSLARYFNFDPVTLEDTQAKRFNQIAAMTEDELGAIFMQAAEWSYANSLVPRLQTSLLDSFNKAEVDAQLVFCIDVRSEPFRRALEAEGNYQTFGYAGFFGLPISLKSFQDDRRKKLLPVLLTPQHEVQEAIVPGRESLARKLVRANARDARARQLFNAAKLGTSTTFATAEAMGPLGAMVMIARTLLPQATKRALSGFGPDQSEVIAPDAGSCCGDNGHGPFTLEDKVGYAITLFKLTGMPIETARLVVLTGHGGRAVNNPYASALDCGACGGHSGGSNARILAAMLNEHEVRVALAARGIVLPERTWFLAAEHNTTTDEVIIFDRQSIPTSHQPDLEKLTNSLARAGASNRARRAEKLGRSADDLLKGAEHWAEIRPEWGLAGNAAFIVSSRDVTREIDLDGRAFLHSYDWKADKDGTALTTILTAPMIVAQWINCQYLFSTIDNIHYGSGDKTTHNVVGGVGVLQGNGGDLQIGLPRQSLFADDGSPYHVPQRLLTIVVAPPERVKAIVESNEVLTRLFENAWVQLIVIDPETGKARRWSPRGAPSQEGNSPFSITA